MRLAPNKGRTLPLLELALELRHNRKTRRTMLDVRTVWDRVRPPRWLIVLQKHLFSLYNVVRVLTYPHTERATGVSYRGTATGSIRRKLAMAVECTSNAPTISEVATAQAGHLWRSFEGQQVVVSYDNYRCYISGPDPHNHDKSVNETAVAVLHTTLTLLSYHHALVCLILDVVAQAVPPAVAYLVRRVGLLLQKRTIPHGPVLRTWGPAPLDFAPTAVVSLNRRPLLLSELNCGAHVELLAFFKG